MRNAVMVLALASTSVCTVGLLGCDPEESCSIGTEGCGCSESGTCLEGLMCLSDLCVDSAGQGAGGSGTGTGGSGTGTGGSGTGTGGVGTGTGGETSGTGGAGTGTGGETSGTGGVGTGGSSSGGAGMGGSAGSVGVGGTTGTSNNLINNGDFSQGGEYWELTFNDGDIAGFDDTGGEYCVGNLSQALLLSFSLGNPPTPTDAFPVEAGASYALSYRVYGYGVFTAKLGLAVSPYTPLVEFNDSVAQSSYASHSFSFQATSSASQVGLVFNGTIDYGTLICFDDVVLVKL